MANLSSPEQPVEKLFSGDRSFGIIIVEDKKTMESQMTNFTKHVKLIREQDGLDAADAKMRAWLEGPEGYASRTEPVIHIGDSLKLITEAADEGFYEKMLEGGYAEWSKDEGASLFVGNINRKKVFASYDEAAVQEFMKGGVV